MPTKKTKQNPAAVEIDPRFRARGRRLREVPGRNRRQDDVFLRLEGEREDFRDVWPKTVRHQTSQGPCHALVKEGPGKNFDPGHGRVMKEWVVVAEGGPDWLELAKEAYEFVKRGHA